ncbi:sugar transferase [Halobacteria archaeon AArc-m2/3/4]|uniref:Sugar transferase n=1 Tax=Natronoglomus mannanivorans TaxID=2979990 RepID=A0ABT2QJC6_9EURY|nr:sugar transferase [Halobacteria archaeon AArc-m2/3/4]
MLATGGVVHVVQPASGQISELQLATLLVTGVTIGLTLLPLYEPQPRRVLALLKTTFRRLAVACLILVAVGSIGVLHVPSPSSVLILGGVLGVGLPIWFYVLRRRDSAKRTLVVGDDPMVLESVVQTLPVTPIGFLSPVLANQTTSTASTASDAVDQSTHEDQNTATMTPDGGVQMAYEDSTSLPAIQLIDSIDGVDRLNGLSRLESTLRAYDIDTVALAFSHADREECFGVLRTCHELGVDVVAHESLEDSVLTDVETEAGPEDNLLYVDVEPWSWHSRVAKRLFDIAFSAIGLLALSPLLALIAIAIKLDSPGPVFYRQERTSELGGSFPVLKFRSMLPESEEANPQSDEENNRITSVGSVLRKTHLDEIPQLVSILTGDMSVVGPRAAWIDEEELLEAEVENWPQRWYVKPGLTGLAQINHASSVDGERKLEFDLEYIRRQSLRFDCTIVCTQLWLVACDVSTLIRTKLINSNS